MTHNSASAPMLGTPYYKKLKNTELLIPTSHYVICEGRGPESFSLSSFRLCLCSLSLCVWSMIGFLLYLIIDPLLSLFFSPYFLSLVIPCQWNMIRLYLSKILAFSANKCMCYPHIRCSSYSITSSSSYKIRQVLFSLLGKLGIPHPTAFKQLWIVNHWIVTV